MRQSSGVLHVLEGRIYNLDMLRGIAALLVLIYHAIVRAAPELQGSNTVFSASYLAVDIFFVMSGFVIPLSYEKRFDSGMRLRTFIWLRFKRLWPMYVIGSSIGIAFAIAIAMIHFDSHVFFDIIVQSTFAISMMPYPKSLMLFPFNSPGWTLFAELCANILYAAVALRWLPRTWIFSTALSGLVLLYYVLLNPEGGADVGAIWENVIIGWARAWFGFGIGYLIYMTRAKFLYIHAHPFVLFAAFVAICVLPCPAEFVAMRDIIFILFLSPALIFTLVRSPSVVSINRVSEWLGDASYPIYAIHMPIIGCLVWANRFFMISEIRLIIVCFIVAILCAYIAKFRLEKPTRILLVWSYTTSRSVIRFILTMVKARSLNEGR